MAITQKTLKQSTHPCGFCSTGGRHDLCPGGVLNGNQVEVVLCGCTQHEIVRRCLECGLRSNAGVAESTWTCLDPEECEGRRAKARAAYATTDVARVLTNQPEKPTRAPAKPKTGKCLCCGETTGGGLFRPGHDSKYLTSAVTLIRDGQISLDDTLTKWHREGLSVALQGKLQKRVGA